MLNEEALQVVGQYHIRVRRGDLEVEVSGPEEGFVLRESNRLLEHFSQAQTSPSPTQRQEQPAIQATPIMGRPEKQQTLNEFFRQFKLQTHQEKILVLGYWLEIKQEQPYFGPEDVLAKYKEAREQPPANVRRDLSNLVAKGFLRTDKGENGTVVYSFTNTGIREVEAKLPS